MARGLLNCVYVVAAHHVHRGEGPPGGMARDELPLRSVADHQLAGHPLLETHELRKSDVPHQIVECVVVVADACRVRGLVVVSLQDVIDSARIHRELVYVDHGKVAGLLLRDAEDVALEACGVDAHHIGMTLPEADAQDEHIADPLHTLDVVLAPARIEHIYVEIDDAGHFIRGQRDLLVVDHRHAEVRIGGRHRGVVLD